MTDDAPLLPLDEDLTALVDRTRAIPAAPAASKSRVLARVEALVGPPPGGGGGGGDSSGAHAPRTAIGSLSGSVRRWIVPMAASFALGAGVGAFAMHEHDGRRDDPAASLPGSAIARPAVTPPSPVAVPAPSIETPPAHDSAPPVTTDRARTTPAPGAMPIDQLTLERSLLDVARGALEREDPRAALVAATRHERRFPNGILVQEREAMVVRALVALGRMKDARERVDLFRRRFPDSLLLPTLEDAIREKGVVPRQ